MSRFKILLLLLMILTGANARSAGITIRYLPARAATPQDTVKKLKYASPKMIQIHAEQTPQAGTGNITPPVLLTPPVKTPKRQTPPPKSKVKPRNEN